MEKQPAVPGIFYKLKKLEKIEKHHLIQIEPNLRKDFIKFLCDELFKLKDVERDAFYEKARAVLNQEGMAEYNHAIIIAEIENALSRTGQIPAVVNIAQSTGLSRKTVNKHLKNFRMTETWNEKKNALNIMSQNVVSLILQRALNGDLRAGKIYLDYVSKSLAAETMGRQNNYIQINNTIINQQLIQQLNPEQLKLIEQIVSESDKGAAKNDNEEMKALGE